MGIHPLYGLNELTCGQGFRLLETTEGEVRELLPGYPCLFLRAILAMAGGVHSSAPSVLTVNPMKAS